MILFDNVSFGYQAGHLIVAEVSFQIKPREKVCLLGLNGSGKSTLLKLAAGLLAPARGRVSIDGMEPNTRGSARNLRARLAFMFQDPQDQIVATTVAADLAFAPENLGFELEEIRRRVAAMAERFGLAGLLSRHPAALSGGEQQRTALAGALAPSPGVVLLDESTSYLDSRGKARLYDTILADPSLTVLAATQYPEEAKLFGRVILLHEGSVVFSGNPADFLESPSWRQVAVCPPSDSVACKDPREMPAKDRRGTLLSAESLCFGYQDDRDVVRKVSLQVSGGEVLAVVGHSGSGKTTLGLLLAGLIQPRAGKVRRAADARQSASVGFLMQFPEAQFFAETVHDEIAFGLLPERLATAEAQRRVKKVLEQVGLDYRSFAARSPFSLSGGEQRRVAIASALVRNPGILILDEPTVALDWQGADRLARLLGSLRRQGKALVVLSHDLDFSSRISTHIALLYRGTIRWLGSKFAGDFPAATFAAEFGAIPQPLTEARELHKNGWALESIESRLTQSQRP